jgi:enediyne biosynthesis protein E4
VKRLLWIAAALLLASAGGWLWWLLHRPAVPADDSLAKGPPWFADVTDRAGLTFTHDGGPLGSFPMPQIFGSGVAFFDFDGDGRPDIYLLTSGGPDSPSTNRLFRNMPDGTFQDVTEGSGLGIRGWNTGVAIGDVNNDGRPDVLVTQYGGVKLFLNRGHGKFEDVTEAAGLVNRAWGASAAFFDYDRDGWLDLVIVNYVDYDPSWVCTESGTCVRDYCPPQPFPGTVSRLFRNRGPQADDGVRFEDVSVASGIGRIPGPGLGVLCADFDGDGWPDVFVANDGKANHLWINQKNGTFVEEAGLRGVAFDKMANAQAGMGVAFGDIDGDGLMDLFVTHLRSETHTVWKQGPRGLFLDRTSSAGLSRLRWQGTGFGTILADFDLDGRLDLAIVNGHVARAKTPAAASRLGPHWSAYADRNQFFVNDGRGGFTDVSDANPAFCGRWNVARGLACADIDGDGKLDLLVGTIADRVRLYRNVAPAQGRWLAVRARLPSPRDPANAAMDRDALGAEVVVEAGPQRWLRLIHAASSYLSSSEPRAHFGLGAAGQVDRILVHWPNGAWEQFAGSAADRLVEVRQGQGRPHEA